VHFAIREGANVLVVDENNRATELYDLASDPRQSDNRIEDPEQRGRVSAMLEKYLRHNDRDDHSFSEPRTTPVLQPVE
jgi:hypothetical protein